jgi:hypothetical protein
LTPSPVIQIQFSENGSYLRKNGVYALAFLGKGGTL